MVTLANRCYYDLNGQLNSKDLSRTTKLILYKTLNLLVVLYALVQRVILSLVQIDRRFSHAIQQ